MTPEDSHVFFGSREIDRRKTNWWKVSFFVVMFLWAFTCVKLTQARHTLRTLAAVKYWPYIVSKAEVLR